LVEPLPVGGLSRNRERGKGDSPIFADTKIGTVPRERLLRILLLRCRGGNVGRSVDVELDDETYRVHSLEQRRWQVAT
jgi:hypothetical protein